MDQMQIAGKTLESLEAARKRLGICRATFYRRMHEDKLPKPVRIGYRNYFDREEVDRFIIERW
jgi:predicted DNA-binding transcriptional regulator AlpA